MNTSIYNSVMKFILALTSAASLLHLCSSQNSVVNIGSKIDRKQEKKKRVSFFASATEVKLNQDAEESSSDEELVLDQDSYYRHYMQKCELGFEGVQIALEQKGKNMPDRLILDGSLKGKAMPGRMLAVMGPSGSGKSSLIHALAGRIADSSQITVSGMSPTIIMYSISYLLSLLDEDT